MLAAALGTRGWQSFRIGYVAGFTHYLASLYWLLLIPFQWHGIPVGPGAGWLALSAFLSLFPATWVWVVCKAQSPKPKVQSAETPADLDGTELLPATWRRRTVWSLSGAAVWVGLEMIVARIFGGFPWNLLGDSQYQMTPLIQVASVTGVYGVSFMIVWTSLAMLSAVVRLVRAPAMRSVW